MTEGVYYTDDSIKQHLVKDQYNWQIPFTDAI